jgi:hypothetical protein
MTTTAMARQYNAQFAEMAVTTGVEDVDELIEVAPGVFKRIGECTAAEISERHKPKLAEVLRNRRGAPWEW